MKMRNNIFMIILFLYFILIFNYQNILIAHTNFYTVKTFGKVKVRFLTGYKYEEINNGMIIGKLADSLRNVLNYQDSILLDFSQQYNDNSTFISYENGKNRYYNKDEFGYFEGFENCYSPIAFENYVIMIRLERDIFKPIEVLKLLEYSILNLNYIIQNQNEFKYNEMIYKSIKNNIKDSILISMESETVNKINKNKFYCLNYKNSELNDTFGIYQPFTYYYQENNYYIVYKDFDSDSNKFRDLPVIKLESIYDFRILNNQYLIVFDTDYSFYSYNANTNKVSKKQIMANHVQNYEIYLDNWHPKDINYIGGDLVSIYYGNYFEKSINNSQQNSFKILKRYLIYNIKEENLNQDVKLEP